MMNKRIKEGIKKYHKPNVKIKFCLGTTALVLGCLMLLIIATFTQIKINFNIPSDSLSTYLKFEYIPQIPVVLFISALLGEFWGLITILLYIILGLTPMFPIFALGGGLSYIFQYNFGYIFGYIFGVILSSKTFKNNNSVLNMFLAVLYGVLAIHAIGIVYMSIIAILRHDGANFISNLIYYQSLSKILYDIVFSFIAVISAKCIRKILWVFIG